MHYIYPIFVTRFKLHLDEFPEIEKTKLEDSKNIPMELLEYQENISKFKLYIIHF